MEQQYKRFVLMRQEVLEDETLTPGEKLLLARYSGFEGVIFESPEQTGKFLGVSAEGIRKHRQKLEKLGYLKCVENNGRGKKYITTAKLTGETSQNGVSDSPKWLGENKEENKEEKPKGFSVAHQPEAGSHTSRKKSEMNLTVEKICSILSIDVSKLNWKAVGAWYKEGLNSNCSPDDFITAAKAMKEACDEQGVFASLQKVLTNTSYWLSRAPQVTKSSVVWNPDGVKPQKAKRSEVVW